MDSVSYQLGGVLLIGGAALVYLAAFFPRALHFLPRNRWFFGFGREVTRVAAGLIGCACMLYALVLGQVIPAAYKGLAVVCCLALIAAAGLYDLTRPHDSET